MKKQPKQGILRKTVNEGRYTINARTGERLHPKTGEPLPAKENPLTMKQMFAQKPAAKKPAGLSLDQVWRKVEDVVSSVYPDGDPIDHLAPWLEKQGIKGHRIGDVLRKAAVKNGYSDVYDYFNSMGDLSEASERWVVKYWDKQSENSPAEREFSSKDRANAFLATLPADYIKSLRPSSGPRQDQGMGESYDEYEDDEQQDEGFFVVIGDEEDYSVFIGMLVKEDGKWRERTYSGNPPTNWGGTYMGYLTPQDVMSWLQKDYGRNYQVDGPFDSEEEAIQHADMLREAAPSIKPREVNPDARANIHSRRKALQAIIMDPDTARDPALRREVARKKAELARMEREAGMVSEDQGGAVEAYGYAYNRKDQRVTWRRVFKSAEAAQAWAAKRNATVLGTRPVDGKQQGISEGPNDGKEDNFTIDDIKNLEQIQDLETLKARAKELIKGKPARRMKPEKISWFYNHIDNLKRPLDVIKMMYDLLLAGEGNKVIGTRHTMSNNSYRQRFGEQSAAEGYEGDDRGDYYKTARAANQASRTAKSKQDHAKAADLHDRAATYGLSAGQDQSVIRDHQMAAWEHKRASKGLREGSLTEGQYEMMMRNGQVKKFVAKDDADARRIAKGNGAKSVIRLKGGVPAGKVLEQGVSEGLPGSLSKSDYTPGKTVKHKDTNCTTCHGRKAMYKLGNKLYADNKPGATKVKCPSCKGTGDKQGVAEGSEERGQNRLRAMITDYEQRAKATKNDIKKAHYLKMASELRGKLKTSDEQGVAEGSENLSYIGNCTDDDVIEHIFGDATGFAQAVEEYGDEFTLDDLVVKYDPESDVHSFYYKKQGVEEGFGDVVKGIKRKVAGKEDPKEVEHMYGRIARSAIKHKTPDQAEKDIGRYKKVAKVVNKKG